MMDRVFDKTDKGREEIATRRYQLAARLRSILLMVDGKQSGEALLQKYAGIGVSAQVLQDLIDQGYISARAESPSAAAAPVETAAPPPQSKEAPLVAVPTLAPGQTQYQAIYQFYCETIKANLGLRALPLQLKVERCNTVDDLRALRTAYLEAVLKSRGNDTARELRDKLDPLLNMNPQDG
jgi:hypothetical protein